MATTEPSRRSSRATLQSPSFVYRSEIGQPSTTPGARVSLRYEVARSFHPLPDSGPDDALWAAAASLRAETPEGVSKQIRSSAHCSFVSEEPHSHRGRVLGARPVSAISQDRPALGSDDVKNEPGHRSRSSSSTDLLWTSIGPISDSLDVARTFLIARLATLYGSCRAWCDGDGVRPITFPAGRGQGF